MTEETKKAEAPAKREDGFFPKSYDPKKDAGPERYETSLGLDDTDTPLSAEEVSLEKSRKDETTLLANESYPGELK